MAGHFKPKSYFIHPAVDDDYAELLKGSEAFRFQVGSGWEMAHGQWLQDGLPESSFGPPRERNGFSLCVMDEFGCTFVLGWCGGDERMVLFAVAKARPREAREAVIDRFRKRIEAVKCES